MGYFKVRSHQGHPDGIHRTLDQKIKQSMLSGTCPMLSIRGQDYPLELQALYAFENDPKSTAEQRPLFFRALKKFQKNSSFTPEKLKTLPASAGYESAPKPTAIHQKTSQGPLLKGSIALEGAMTRMVNEEYGFDPTDRTYGSFPEDAVDVSKQEKEKFQSLFDLEVSKTESQMNKKVDRQITAVKKTPEGQLYIQVTHHRPNEVKTQEGTTSYRGREYQFKSGEKQTRYYTQRMMDLSIIKKYMKLGLLSVESFENNCCKITQKDFPDLPKTFILDLKEETLQISPPEDSINQRCALDAYISLNASGKLDSQDLVHEAQQSFLAFIDKHENKKVPLAYTKKNSQNQSVTCPVMEQVGSKGLVIRGDLDMMHIAYKKELFSANTQEFSTDHRSSLSTQSSIINLSNPINTFSMNEQEFHNYKEKVMLYLQSIISGVEKTGKIENTLFDNMGFTSTDQAKKFLDFLSMHFDSLKKFGAGSTADLLHTAVMNFKVHGTDKSFSSFYFQHGCESYNPGHCEDFGACAVYVCEKTPQGNTEVNCYHTATEYDYLQLLLDKNLEKSVMRISPAHMGYKKDSQGEYKQSTGTVNQDTALLWAMMAMMQSETPLEFENNTDQGQKQALSALYESIKKNLNHDADRQLSQPQQSFCAYYEHLNGQYYTKVSALQRSIKYSANILLYKQKSSESSQKSQKSQKSLNYLMKQIKFEMLSATKTTSPGLLLSSKAGSQRKLQ